MKKLFTFILLGLFMQIAGASLSTTSLDQYLKHSVAKDHQLGLVGLLDQSDSRLWQKAYGSAQKDELFRIASATKPFIATLVVKLAIANKIQLDDKLSQYLSAELLQGIANAKEVTIRQVLSMQSGIYDYIDNPKYDVFVAQHPQHSWTAENAIAFARNMPAEFSVGTASQYSNTNYILLGLLIEEVSGHSLAYELQQKIFDPLQLKNTYLEMHQTIPDKVIAGFEYNNGKYKDISQIDESRGLADGGIVSNAKDLNTFIRRLMTDNNFMPEKWRQQMMVFHPMRSSDKAEYGLGLVKYPSKYGEIIGHDGDNPGYQSWMLYMPKTKASLVVLSNTNPPRLEPNNFFKALG